MLSPYAETVLIVTAINVLLAWSFFTPLAVGRLFAGQVGFYALGAYVAAGLNDLGYTFGIAVLVAGLSAIPASYVIARLALRLSGFALAITSLGFALVFQVVLRNSDWSGGTYGIRNIPILTTLPLALVAVVIVGAALWVLERSRHGQAAMAIRNDRQAAQAMGIPAMRYEVASTVLGCSIAGVAGAFYAHFIGFVQPDLFGFALVISLASWTFFGGTTTFWGPLVGAGILSILPQAISSLYEYRLLAYAIVVILVVLFRPDGVVTRRGVVRVARLARRGVARLRMTTGTSPPPADDLAPTPLATEETSHDSTVG